MSNMESKEIFGLKVLSDDFVKNYNDRIFIGDENGQLSVKRKTDYLVDGRIN